MEKRVKHSGSARHYKVSSIEGEAERDRLWAGFKILYTGFFISKIPVAERLCPQEPKRSPSGADGLEALR